ncbi:hypothetical protein BH09ACT1_BH09ACT1_23500 [soil metagenome]
MKILAFILSIVVATALLMGGVFLIIAVAPQHSNTGYVLASTISLTLFIYGPLLLGSLTAYWDVRNSPESRRIYSVWFWITIAVEALSAIALIVFVVLAGAPVGIAALIIIVGAALTLIAPVIGRALLRYDHKRRPDDGSLSDWTPITRAEINRKVRAVAITFTISLFFGLVGFVALGQLSGHRLAKIDVELLYAFSFASIAAAVACLIVTFPLNSRLRENVSRDLGVLRKIGRVVLRGRSVDLSPEDQVAAAKYAVVVSVTLPFQFANVALLFLGIGIQRIEDAVSGRSTDIFSIVLIAAYVVIVVGFAPLYILRIRRARRYASDHADLLPTTVPR